MTNTASLELLDHALGQLPPGVLYVGFSGGIDSHVLLHALARSPAARTRGLHAIHVDHAIHARSAEWAQHCQTVAESLDVPFISVRVALTTTAGLGLEASARAARYEAFALHVPAAGVLVLAHHADDQTETILLKLLRGAGPQGLSGMRTLRRWNAGLLWRPLLTTSRQTLQQYAHAHGLHWIDDPSNDDPAHARNFLRQQILPALRQRWPRIDTSVGHSARWLGACADYIDAQANTALAQIQGLDPTTLAWGKWLQLPTALRAVVLRLWLRQNGLATPQLIHVEQLEQQLAEASADRLPCVAWSGTQLRRYRDLLYAMPTLPPTPAAWRSDWNGQTPLPLPASMGVLELSPKPASHVALQVRLREGGESFKPAGDAHTRDLRDLFQQAGIPPWQRARLPILYAEEQLVAVGDLWCSEFGARWLDQHGTQLHWHSQSKTGVTPAPAAD